MRKFLSAPMELHLQIWGGIYPHNQMQLQLIPLPPSAVSNHHPSTRVHQRPRVVIKTRPTFTPTPSSILVHCYHFFPFSPAILFLAAFSLGGMVICYFTTPWRRLVSWCLVRLRVTLLRPFSQLPERYPAAWSCWLLCSGPIDCDIIDLGHIHDSWRIPRRTLLSGNQTTLPKILQLTTHPPLWYCLI